MSSVSAYSGAIAQVALTCAIGLGVYKYHETIIVKMKKYQNNLPDTVRAYLGPVTQAAGAITLGVQISKYQNGPMLQIGALVQTLAFLLIINPDYYKTKTPAINTANTLCALVGANPLNHHLPPYQRAFGMCCIALWSGKITHDLEDRYHHWKATKRELVCNAVAHGCLGLYACYIGHKALSSNAIGNLAAGLSLLAGAAKLAALAIRKFRSEAPHKPSIAEFMERFTQTNLVVAGGIAFGALLNRLGSVR